MLIIISQVKLKIVHSSPASEVSREVANVIIIPVDLISKTWKIENGIICLIFKITYPWPNTQIYNVHHVWKFESNKSF